MGGKSVSFIRITVTAERKTMEENNIRTDDNINEKAEGTDYDLNDSAEKSGSDTEKDALDIWQEEKEKHMKMVDDIWQKRVDNPVSLVCPHCSGQREIDRVAGVFRCPYCDSVDPVPEEHKHIRELDGPLPLTREEREFREMFECLLFSLITWLFPILSSVCILFTLAGIVCSLSVLIKSHLAKHISSLKKPAIVGLVLNVLSTLVTWVYILNN